MKASKIGFVGTGKDQDTLRAAGVVSLYVGSWGSCRRALHPGDTVVVTEARRIARRPERVETVARELAEAGITLVILDRSED
jgi:hypothetical protein